MTKVESRPTLFHLEKDSPSRPQRMSLSFHQIHTTIPPSKHLLQYVISVSTSNRSGECKRKDLLPKAPLIEVHSRVCASFRPCTSWVSPHQVTRSGELMSTLVVLLGLQKPNCLAIPPAISACWKDQTTVP